MFDISDAGESVRKCNLVLLLLCFVFGFRVNNECWHWNSRVSEGSLWRCSGVKNSGGTWNADPCADAFVAVDFQCNADVSYALAVPKIKLFIFQDLPTHSKLVSGTTICGVHSQAHLQEDGWFPLRWHAAQPERQKLFVFSGLVHFSLGPVCPFSKERMRRWGHKRSAKLLAWQQRKRANAEWNRLELGPSGSIQANGYVNAKKKYYM